MLGEPRYLVEGGAHAHAHDKRRAGVGCLLAHAVEHDLPHALDSCAGGEHDYAGGVVRPAALQKNVQRRAVPRLGRDLGESGRVVACVRAVEKRVVHDAHAQTPVGVGPRDRVVDLREDIAGDGKLLADFEPHPAGSRVLAQGHAVLARDLRILQQAVEHRLRARLLLDLACGSQAAEHVFSQTDRSGANRVVGRVRHALRRESIVLHSISLLVLQMR